jgi:hypothetical protein
MRRYFISVLLLASLLLSACTTAAPTTDLPATVAPTGTRMDTASPAPTTTGSILPTDTSPPPASTGSPPPMETPTTPGATITPSPAPDSEGSPPDYLDDRSTAASLMASFANALNHHQYLRAYSYWRPDAPQLQPFPQFEAGYSDTQSVALTLGGITGDAGAGQLYYAVPVAMVAQTTAGVAQTFVGCYVLHLAQPGIQAEPPFHPLSIDRAEVQQVPNDADTAALLTQACTAYPGIPVQPTPTSGPNEIGAERYLDDRSSAAEVIRSLFNAVNRHEYARAYYYWQDNGQGLEPFSQFEQGYADTATVQLAVGAVSTSAGAGQRYYSVPVTLVATTTANATQTFVGCYNLHLSVPEIQATPPYQPIGVISANVQQVANDADTAALMDQACPQP